MSSLLNCPPRRQSKARAFLRLSLSQHGQKLLVLIHRGRFERPASRPTLFRRPRVPGILCAVLLVCATAGAQRIQPGEDAIKAAFLYNFTKFIDWPETAFPGASPHFTVCVFAGETFRRELETIMHGEQVRGRPVTVAPPDRGSDLKGCHLVYFGAEEAEGAGKRLATVRQVPVLTVGEGEHFLDQGGLIAFTLENDRIRFDISKKGAETAGLNVSSKLLRVARQIRGATLP